MQITKIHFEQLFPTGVYANQRLRVEISLEDSDFEPQREGDHFIIPNSDQVVYNAFQIAKKLVNDAFEKMNPQIKWDEKKEDSFAIVDFPISKGEKVQGMKELLNLCTTKQLLERQRGQVERLGNEEVTNLFNEKMQPFQ